jgi:hypothetical protein
MRQLRVPVAGMPDPPAELRRHYEAGRSIREISDETHYPISRVRSLLQIAETPIRPRGKSSVSSNESEVDHPDDDRLVWDELDSPASSPSNI